MKKVLIIVLIFLSFLSVCKAYNTPIDSLEKLVKSSSDLNKIALWKLQICKIRYLEPSVDVSKYLNELHFMLNQIDNKDTYIEICMFSGQVYRSTGQYDNALKYDFLGLKRAEKSNDIMPEAKLLKGSSII